MSSRGSPAARPGRPAGTLRAYGVSIASVALCAVAWLVLDRVLGMKAPLLIFIPGVLVASALGGLLPGLLATALSLVIGISFDYSAESDLPKAADAGPVSRRA
jgi:two-component system sensor kinase FixL